MANSNYYDFTVKCICENCKTPTLCSQADADDGIIHLCSYCHAVYSRWAENLKTSGFAYDWMKTASARKCKSKGK